MRVKLKFKQVKLHNNNNGNNYYLKICFYSKENSNLVRKIIFIVFNSKNIIYQFNQCLIMWTSPVPSSLDNRCLLQRILNCGLLEWGILFSIIKCCKIISVIAGQIILHIQSVQFLQGCHEHLESIYQKQCSRLVEKEKFYFFFFSDFVYHSLESCISIISCILLIIILTHEM